MQNTTLTLLLAGSVLGLAASPSSAQQVAVGDQPSYRLGNQTFNAMGVTGSDDLRGKPVLVEFWGTR